MDAATTHAWKALGGAADLAGHVTFVGAPGLASPLPVRELARATVGVCSLAAAELLAARTGRPLPEVRVDEGAVAVAFTSERHLRVDGRPIPLFAPLSGFWRAQDGWVRTHANYPHHRDRLLAALGIPDTGDETSLVDRLSAVVAELPAVEVQERAYAADGLAVAVAPPAPSDEPLVTSRPTGTGRSLPARRPSRPADGIRVLDLTRVLAGPVATRSLALLGADVLRVDPPWLPEEVGTHLDTGFGKRSTRLALDDPADRSTFDELLDGADVVVMGYRPGALDRHGLGVAALHERRPDLVVVELDAWAWEGTWAGRRGFDSLVQARCGIADLLRAADGRPGALPAQALDHGTGYLVAAAVLRGLTDRAATGAGRHVRASLTGTAAWLLSAATSDVPTPAGSEDPDRWLVETDSPYGRLRYARSPLGVAGLGTQWDHPPSVWGTDEARWASTSPPG
ncbi:CoA transferase [Cellulomonas xylanilytica]|uniref:CoA-transferase n=1 Tax=Cellulomonas xylanilytica TaxID=233583 RepID=A0A510V1X3_9CELL|nr:CoA transferase [Cellulomonas xylanilytica]GEK19831.1 CoA-transferase [Cellulomonas xylanilytica]